MKKRGPLSEEHKKKVSLALKGHRPYFIAKGKDNPFYGKKHSPEMRKKISEKTKKYFAEHPEAIEKIRQAGFGRVPFNKGIKKRTNTGRTHFKKGFTPWNKNKPFMTREKHWNWQGGITPINASIRQSLEYKLWRIAVFERDKYTCIWCGAKSGKGKKVILHADHIKPFAYFPELRFAIDNGRTLCKNCHKTTDTYKKKLPRNNI